MPWWKPEQSAETVGLNESNVLSDAEEGLGKIVKVTEQIEWPQLGCKSERRGTQKKGRKTVVKFLSRTENNSISIKMKESRSRIFMIRPAFCNLFELKLLTGKSAARQY